MCGRLLPILILPLFYRVTKLDDVPLLERIRRLCDGTGLTGDEARVLSGVERIAHMGTNGKRSS